jgi:hypothetical protein
MNEFIPDVIVLGGGWEQSIGPLPLLSIETRIRMLALGTIAENGADISEALLLGGIQAPRASTAEAEGMLDYLSEQFPHCAIRATLDMHCHDTWSSAQRAAQLISANSAIKPGLLTSRSHLPRATKIFHEKGLAIRPVDAETILLHSEDANHQELAKNYLHSMRYVKWLGMEAVMRAGLYVDKQGKLSQRLAWHARSKRYDG